MKYSLPVALGTLGVFLLGSAYITYSEMPIRALTTPTPIQENTQTSPENLSTSQSDTDTDPQSPDPETPPPSDTPVVSITPSEIVLPIASETTPSSPALPAGFYTLTTVGTHNSPADCWSVVEGNVYDLTSWISRHPGGTRPIESMCGKDASSSFEKKHGGSSVAKAALVLLKIGTLQE